MQRLIMASLALAILGAVACSDSTTAPNPTPRTINVAKTGEFGPSGTVSITNVSGSNSNLSATLIGFDASTDHSVVIVAGSCSAPGAPALTLANLSANSSGQATIASTSVPDVDVASGYAILFYATTSTTSDVIACGDLS
ncbi:MAG: hypothetical protein ABI889_04810 [Gemmatimonadota bacterium]